MKNKYLDDLGLAKYGADYFAEDNDSFKQQREMYGFDSRECWSLKHAFVEWLYSHLKMYLDDASKIVDLSFHKFIHNEKEYTQQEAIEYIVDKCESFLLLDKRQFDTNPYKANSSEYFKYMRDIEIKAYEDMTDAIELFAGIFPSMWW